MKQVILWLLPKRFGAVTLFGKVYMRDFTDIVLYAHERTHAVQQHRNPFLFYFRYLFSKKWRLQYEAEAYAVSVNSGETLPNAILLLVTNYNLNITDWQARQAIGKYL